MKEIIPYNKSFEYARKKRGRDALENARPSIQTL